MTWLGIIAIVVAVFAFVLFLVVGIPSRCGVCHAWRTITGNGFSVAGEYIFHDAWCERCKEPMYVDSAGYIRHRGFLWLTTIPRRTQEHADEILAAAKAEVDLIAPNAE